MTKLNWVVLYITSLAVSILLIKYGVKGSGTAGLVFISLVPVGNILLTMILLIINIAVVLYPVFTYLVDWVN